MYFSKTSIETPPVEDIKYPPLQSVLLCFPQYGKLYLSTKKELDFDFKHPIMNARQSYTGASPGIHVWGNRTSTDDTSLLASLVVEPEKVVSPLMTQALSFR